MSNGVAKAPATGINGTYSCYLYSGKAVALIEDHALNYASQGMFLYLPFHDVHEPYQAEDRFRDPSCPDQGPFTKGRRINRWIWGIFLGLFAHLHVRPMGCACR